MLLNEIPAFFHPEIRSLIDTTLERAWLELRKDNPNDEVSAGARCGVQGTFAVSGITELRQRLWRPAQ